MEVIFRSGQPVFPGGWTPDNDRILFAGFEDAVWNIYAVSRSTKKLERLTRNAASREYVRYPDWMSGNRIVYEYNETRGNIFVGDLR